MFPIEVGDVSLGLTSDHSEKLVLSYFRRVMEPTVFRAQVGGKDRGSALGQPYG